MKHRPLFASNALCALGFSAWLLAACGGRFQTIREVEDDDAGGASSAGAPSVGRAGSASSRAGASSGGASSAGASSAGASSGGASSGGSGSGGQCSTVKCATPMCPPGSTPVTQPGFCCATCSSNCPPCPDIACAPGSHFETLPGNCCPICVEDGEATCKNGRAEYAVLRDVILNKYTVGCAADSECVVIAPRNLCEQGCSYASVWYGVADSFESNLSNAADMYCGSCKPGPIPACAPPPSPHCINAQCR